MARNKRSRRGVDSRMILFLILSVMIVLSMVLAYLPGLLR